MTADVVEKFLVLRGILKSDGPIKDKKEKEVYTLCNESSFLKQEEHEKAAEIIAELNDELKNTENLEEVEFEAETMDYKTNLLKAYRGMIDPFDTEIVGEKFDYEPNPSDPANP